VLPQLNPEDGQEIIVLAKPQRVAWFTVAVTMSVHGVVQLPADQMVAPLSATKDAPLYPLLL